MTLVSDILFYVYAAAAGFVWLAGHTYIHISNAYNIHRPYIIYIYFRAAVFVCGTVRLCSQFSMCCAPLVLCCVGCRWWGRMKRCSTHLYVNRFQPSATRCILCWGEMANNIMLNECAVMQHVDWVISLCESVTLMFS